MCNKEACVHVYYTHAAEITHGAGQASLQPLPALPPGGNRCSQARLSGTLFIEASAHLYPL